MDTAIANQLDVITDRLNTIKKNQDLFNQETRCHLNALEDHYNHLRHRIEILEHRLYNIKPPAD